MDERPQLRLFGLASRRPRWGLTWRGRFAVLLGLLALAAILILQIQPFLALSKPVDARIMVVEGWISVPSLEAAAEEFRRGGYDQLYTVGGPSSEHGGASGEGKISFAQITANQFYEMGLSHEQVHAVPAGEAQRDRTYTSATTLRDWFRGQGIAVGALNVVTEGVHSRRSRLMFEAAFGSDVQIGVISIPDAEYEASHWWRYSEGVKEVISEGAAYLYARFLFRAGE